MVGEILSDYRCLTLFVNIYDFKFYYFDYNLNLLLFIFPNEVNIY